jgi:hypothetical protein
VNGSRPGSRPTPTRSWRSTTCADSAGRRRLRPLHIDYSRLVSPSAGNWGGLRR